MQRRREGDVCRRRGAAQAVRLGVGELGEQDAQAEADAGADGREHQQHRRRQRLQPQLHHLSL